MSDLEGCITTAAIIIGVILVGLGFRFFLSGIADRKEAHSEKEKNAAMPLIVGGPILMAAGGLLCYFSSRVIDIFTAITFG